MCFKVLLLALLIPTAQLFAECCVQKARAIDPAKKYTFDYIIVGDGTAGAILARKLSNDKSKSVLVLEWGKNRTNDPVVLSPNVFEFSNTLTYNPKYAINPIAVVDFPGRPPQQFIYSDGRMWGGSSAHNGLFAVRGTPHVYNRWAAISGNPIWRYNSLLPIMKNMEDYHPTGTVADLAQRGISGKLAITQSPPVNQDPFAIAVAQATGSPLISDYNNPSLGDIGVSAHQQWITPPGANSHRAFSALAYHPVGTIVNANGQGLNGRQLTIRSNALVSRVIFNAQKVAIGVEYWIDGNPAAVQRAFATKKVILCAGSLQTSAILERSGIGNKNILEPLGINTIVDNPNVGEHFQNHYGVRGMIAGTTSAEPFLQGFIDVRPFMPADGIRRMQVVARDSSRGVSISGILLNPKSRGSSHIVDKNPTIYPLVDLNMFSDGSFNQQGSDAYLVVSFYKLLKRIARRYGTEVIFPRPEAYSTDQRLFEITQNLDALSITYHIVGTARMGKSIKDSVVGGNLHVLGVDNLMIADASIQPITEDGNTAYSAFIIGLVAARILNAQ